MIWMLLIVPVCAYLATLFLYKHNGRREVLRFDLVQFVYAFVILPIFFVWIKSFIYFLFRSGLGVTISTGELFVIDTIFSTLFLYLYAFVVIHSVTKTFNLKHYRDPLYDLFAHSEYYHVWLSHVMIAGVAMLVVSLLSFVNVWIPLSLSWPTQAMLVVLASGVVMGILVFVGVWLTDPEQAQYMRLMKLLYGFFFMAHVVVYFLFDPKFSASILIYWFFFMVFAAGVICSLFFERSKKAVRWTNKLKHDMWEHKLYVFKKDK